MAKRKRLKSLRVGAWVDAFSPEAYKRDHEVLASCWEWTFQELGIKPVWLRHLNIEDVLGHHPDILIVDYGGMMFGGSTSLIEEVERQVLNHIKEYPNCFLIVWCALDVPLVERIERELGLSNANDAPNIMVNTKGDNRSDQKVADWFSVTPHHQTGRGG